MSRRPDQLGTPLSDAEREQRSRAGMTHGARSYLARTSASGAGLVTGDMALVESQVLALFAEVGPRGMVEAAALRYEAAAALVWGAAQAQPERAESLLKLWGWLQGCAVRAWRDHAALPSQDDGSVTAATILRSLPEGDNGNR